MRYNVCAVKRMLFVVVSQADQCKPQHIANILWAFGTLGYKPSQHLLDTLQKQATLKLSGFNPQNLANLIWAFARHAPQHLAQTDNTTISDVHATCRYNAYTVLNA